jgi:hypothetical protein
MIIITELHLNSESLYYAKTIFKFKNQFAKSVSEILEIYLKVLWAHFILWKASAVIHYEIIFLHGYILFRKFCKGFTLCISMFVFSSRAFKIAIFHLSESESCLWESSYAGPGGAAHNPSRKQEDPTGLCSKC